MTKATDMYDVLPLELRDALDQVAPQTRSLVDRLLDQGRREPRLLDRKVAVAAEMILGDLDGAAVDDVGEQGPALPAVEAGGNRPVLGQLAAIEVLEAVPADYVVDTDTLAFKAGIAARKQSAKSTRRTYAAVYKQLVAFAGAGTPANALDDELVLAYRDHLERRGLSPATVAKHLSAVRALAREVGGPDVAAIASVKGEGVAKGEPRPLEPEQAARLLAMPDLRTTRGVRDRAMLALMLDAGVRREELVALKVTSIEQTKRHAAGSRAAIPGSTGYSVRIAYGKGGKERVVPLTAAASAAIGAWMAVRPTCAHLQLFLSIPRHGGQVPGPLSVTAVWRMVDAHAKAAGLPDDTAPHTLRHTFASALAAAGVPLEVGQRLLGHADPRTTLVYWKLRQSAGADAITQLEHSRLAASQL